MMNRILICAATMLLCAVAQADNLAGVDRMICAAAQVQLCIENDSCYEVAAADLSVPAFVIIDAGKKTISTTQASGENRSTRFSFTSRQDGLIYLQGVEGGRAFSFVINEASGQMTVAVSRDGLSVSVFGNCTDAAI